MALSLQLIFEKMHNANIHLSADGLQRGVLFLCRAVAWMFVECGAGVCVRYGVDMLGGRVREGERFATDALTLVVPLSCG